MGEKSTGIVRKVDDLGRIVLPMELRRTFDIGDYDQLEIFVEGDRIILRKHQPNCVFCGDVANIQQFMGKNVCKACTSRLSGQAAASQAPAIRAGVRQ